MATSKSSRKPESDSTDPRMMSLIPVTYSVVSSAGLPPPCLPSRSEELRASVDGGGLRANADGAGIGPRDDWASDDILRTSSSSHRTTMDCLRELRCPGGLQDAGLGFWISVLGIRGACGWSSPGPGLAMVFMVF